MPSRVSWHLYVLQIDFGEIGKSRAEVMSMLMQKGVGSQVHYIPVHTQPYYRDRYGYGSGDCPIAESYYKKCLSLPLFPAMTDFDVNQVISAVKEIVR
jgi:dTDP-4-amino-4,6-dideoxygalactose transaminase